LLVVGQTHLPSQRKGGGKEETRGLKRGLIGKGRGKMTFSSYRGTEPGRSGRQLKPNVLCGKRRKRIVALESRAENRGRTGGGEEV